MFAGTLLSAAQAANRGSRQDLSGNEGERAHFDGANLIVIGNAD